MELSRVLRIGAFVSLDWNKSALFLPFISTGRGHCRDTDVQGTTGAGDLFSRTDSEDKLEEPKCRVGLEHQRALAASPQ